MSVRLSATFPKLVAPVFTSFTPEHSVQTDNIAEYASHLYSIGVRAVLVNGTSGEGPALSLDERLRTAAEWRACSHRSGLSMMLQIGGASIGDVQRMAADAQRIGVEAVLLLPDLYFRPRTIDALVEYCERISGHCAQTPLLYYHIPSMTGVNLDMPEFLAKAEQRIANFAGLKYTSGDLEMGAKCLGPNRTVMLGADTIWLAAVALGFESACMTTLNMWPALSDGIHEAMQALETEKARDRQCELSQRVSETLRASGDWVADMKRAMDRELEAIGAAFRVGDVRRPRMQ